MLLEALPARFHEVPYNGASSADGSHDLSGGANCQCYAYAVLAHFGIALPPWWSSELWADRELTSVVDSFEPLDLLLFGRSHDAYGAHVAVFAGEGHALHLCKSVGMPVVWPLTDFASRTEYAVLVGGKRARSRA